MDVATTSRSHRSSHHFYYSDVSPFSFQGRSLSLCLRIVSDPCCPTTHLSSRCLAPCLQSYACPAFVHPVNCSAFNGFVVVCQEASPQQRPSRSVLPRTHSLLLMLDTSQPPEQELQQRLLNGSRYRPCNVDGALYCLS